MTYPMSPGWYPDPSGAPGTRYWDGQRWGVAQPNGTARPRKSLLWLWILLGVFAFVFVSCSAFVFVIGSSGSGGGHHSTGTTVAVGQEARDGKFAFVVKNVRTSNQEGMSKPRGVFVIVTMDVTNIGDQAQSFFVQNQKLVDDEGRVYTVDTSAASWITKNESMIIDLNPGLAFTTQVPFDVPSGTKPAAIEVHDSAFSGGARAALK